MKKISLSLTRRDFIRTTALAAGAIGFPMIVPARLFGADAPSSRVRVGQIGCGRIALGHDLPGVFHADLAEIVAICDIDSKRLANGKAFLEGLYRSQGVNPRNEPMKVPDISAHSDHRELLARKDIDAVVISTPDHSHAELALAAVLAGKDIYLQKPMTMTLAEGIVLRDAIRKRKCIFQIGSQQRSTKQFRRACELVRSGRVGRLQRVEIGLPVDPTAPDQPEQPVPANLNYDRWLGSTPLAYYTEQRVHSQSDVNSRPGWLRNESYCLGMITGWGSHHFDTAHWGMDMELTGPIKIEGKAEFPTNKIWNVHGAYEVELTYPRDIRMHVSNRFPNGIRFIGDEGWIFVSRDSQTTASDPASPSTTLKPLDASDPKLLDPKGVTVELYQSAEHHENWLQCVKSRKETIAPAPVAHRSTSACIVSWIAMKLGRPLTWDAKREQFVKDDAANAMLSRLERAPYGALRLAKV
jgi:predicted dehydrogenase